MPKGDHKEIQVGRRDFMKTTTMASLAATVPATSFADQNAESSSKQQPAGMKKKLLFLSISPENQEKLIESIKSISGADLLVVPVKVNYQNPQEIDQAIHDQNPDIVFMSLSGFVFSYGIDFV